jgi:predicted RNA-binding Zn-ribbon protein involved in translation (DUF1610 family)
MIYSMSLCSIKEAEWSIQLAAEVASTSWECPNCLNTLLISGIEKLQHKKGWFIDLSLKSNNNLTNFLFSVCVKPKIKEESLPETETRQSIRPNAKKYECSNCNKVLYLTSIDILKHKKVCKSEKIEKE